MAHQIRETSVVRAALGELWEARFHTPLSPSLTNRDAWLTLSECGVTQENLQAAIRRAFKPPPTEA